MFRLTSLARGVQMHRWTVRLRVTLLVAALRVVTLTAQDSTAAHQACFGARPAPGCRVAFLTNFGISARVGGGHDPGWRALIDWGFLYNVTPRHSVGATVFASWDANDAVVGPMLRYRRWARTPGRSLDLGIGAAKTGEGENSALSPFGLLKWNVSTNTGIALRPELRQRTVYTCYQNPAVGCVASNHPSFNLSMGVEASGSVGAILTGVAGVALAALVAAFAAED